MGRQWRASYSSSGKRPRKSSERVSKECWKESRGVPRHDPAAACNASHRKCCWKHEYVVKHQHAVEHEHVVTHQYVVKHLHVVQQKVNHINNKEYNMYVFISLSIHTCIYLCIYIYIYMYIYILTFYSYIFI